jgi:hypothetical protein
MDESQFSQTRTTLTRALSKEVVNEIGRRTGQSARLRKVTPHRLFHSIVAFLSSFRVETIADLLGAFNHRFGKTAYKAFYNRLARLTFAVFMREMFCHLLGALSMEVLKPEPDSPLNDFSDILIQDGSSFTLKRALRHVFPGRFTKQWPAAVELHATYSGYHDNPLSVSIAPDKEAERPFLPAPEAMKGKLLLADRGYPSVGYFQKMVDAGAYFVIRLQRSLNPLVIAFRANGKRHPLPFPTPLNQFLSQNQNRALDLDVLSRRKGGGFFRIVVIPGDKKKEMIRLATNLDPKRFPLELVGKLYRFRWQVELCFKEWKSYANLHRFDTANPHIVEGLIWASLCAALLKRFLAHATQRITLGLPVSTRRVAMRGRHVIDPIFTALLAGGRGLRRAIRIAVEYLAVHALRAHPKRDRLKGRLQAGLAISKAA